MKRWLLLFFEKVIFGILCLLVPPRKNLILFGSGFNLFSDNPKFLFLHFQGSADYNPIWITSNKEEVRALRAMGYTCYYKWSFNTFWAVLRASFFFMSHNVSDIFPVIPKRAVLINLWHGTPIKKIGFDSLRERVWIERLQKSGRKLPYEKWDYFIAASPDTVFIFESAMRLPAFKIKALGQPRTAHIHQAVNDAAFKKDIFQKMGFSEEVEKRTTILYTPTFRNNEGATTKMRQTLVEVDRAIGKRKESMILFKPHPLDRNVFDDAFFTSLANVINVSSEDTQDLLCISDVLITDYSSIMFDFMITGNPIIAYIYDEKQYITENGGLYFSFEELNIHIARTDKELINFVANMENLEGSYDASKFNLLNSNQNIGDFLAQLKV
ncbi:CDP-glycerol glycerophosphotransferase family protein [Maribacter sp. 2304DJ31-5]|uniref:CDP-glycerol glycerophosphotransferase family protein n=1 Tax=Maribacter sp. 2304DJ31-5 TaxID=3386273 RepID=UPI0039BCFABF